LLHLTISLTVCLPRHPFVLFFLVASSLVLFSILLLCFVDELVRALSLISNPLCKGHD
jgi:hypothetical protein